MISYTAYKVIHLVGVLMVFLALGGAATYSIVDKNDTRTWRKQIGITHGLGLFISLLGGFGLLARLGMAHESLPGWVIAKLCIWLFFGGIVTLLYRKPKWSPALWPTVIILGGIAAYLGGSKPF